MTEQSYLFAAVAGYVGRPDEVGKTGIFRRAASGGAWENVIPDLEAFTVMVHPGDPAVVLAGTSDGVWRSTDHGKTFAKATFPDAKKQVWSFLVDSRNPSRILAGGSPVDVYRSDDRGATWRRMPNPGIKDRATAPFAGRGKQRLPGRAFANPWRSDRTRS